METSAQTPVSSLPPIQPVSSDSSPGSPILPPNPSLSNKPQGLPKLSRKKILLMGIVIFVILTVVFSFIYFLNHQKAAISGIVDLNGHIPPKSTIAIAERKAGEKQFNIVVDEVSPTDQTPWVWNGAEKGTFYELKAYLRVNGDIKDESEPKIFAAPAANEVLSINSKNTPSAPAPAIISGTVDLNGYVPAGSSIAIAVRKTGEAEFQIVIRNITPFDKAKWNWNDAETGSLYDVKALLEQNEIAVAESIVKTFSAPAANEVLTINSLLVTPSTSPTPLPVDLTPTSAPIITPSPTNAPLPTPTASYTTISGIVDINGVYPGGSTITVAERKVGTSQFNIVNEGLIASDGVSWNWNGALVGGYYQIQAYLNSRGSIISASQILTMAAPAANEVLIINSAKNLQQPDNGPGTQCNQANSNNNWSVNISYGSYNNAKLYWIKVGDINNDSRFIDTKIPPNSQSLPTTYNFNTDYFFAQGVTYYAKYAYSTCDNCSDPFYFSPFSPVSQFTCNPPAPTNTPTKTPSPKPTGPPAPTNTPAPPPPTATPTPTPRVSKCNESCGSSGYSCIDGLQCVSGDMPGSGVCRNPNCPDKTNCSCAIPTDTPIPPINKLEPPTN